MRSHAPFEPIVTKFCMWGRVGDLIADAEFFLKIGSGVSQLQNPPQCHFLSILNAHRPNNSVSTIPCRTAIILHTDEMLTRAFYQAVTQMRVVFAAC